MRQLDVKNRTLQTIHATIDSFHDVIPFAAVSREGFHPIGQPVVVGHDAAGIAVSSKILTGIEGEGGDITKGAG